MGACPVAPTKNAGKKIPAMQKILRITEIPVFMVENLIEEYPHPFKAAGLLNVNKNTKIPGKVCNYLMNCLKM